MFDPGAASLRGTHAREGGRFPESPEDDAARALALSLQGVAIMTGYYAALSPEEMDRIMAHVAQGGHEALEEELAWLMADEELCLDIDKAWHGIHTLVASVAEPGHGAALPLTDLVLGGESLTDVDLAWLPARRFDPAKVAAIAADIAGIDLLSLRELFRATVLGREDVYPGLSEDDDINYLDFYFEQLKAFFAGAASQGKAVLTFIS